MNRRIDIPNFILDRAEDVQRLGAKIPLNWLINPFVSSSSPNYIQAIWEEADHVIDPEDGFPVALPIAEGDPGANLLSLIPRFKNRAAIIGSNVHDMDAALEESKGTPAVAFTYAGKTRVGTLPDGIHDLALSPDSPYYKAATRSGHNDYGAAIGAYLRKDRVFIKPKRAVVIENNVPISELESNIPLV